MRRTASLFLGLALVAVALSACGEKKEGGGAAPPPAPPAAGTK
jgi:hypothetical protein